MYYYSDNVKHSNKMAFLFGAGAEAGYELPTGDLFVRETILTKNDKLLTALKDFYSSTNDTLILNNWFSDYRKESVSSNEIGRLIIVKTISLLIRISPKEFDNCSESLRWAIEQYFSEKEFDDIKEEPIVKDFEGLSNFSFSRNVDSNLLKLTMNWLKLPEKKSLEDGHAELLLKENITLVEMNSKLINEHPTLINLVRENMNSYGALERYFHTIINPKKYGPNNFWKLINYYWQAYFSVTIPVCNFLINNQPEFFEPLGLILNEENEPKEIVQSEENYSLILNNIEFFCEKLWSESAFALYRDKENHYYQQEMVKSAEGIITTNYTPLLCSINTEPQRLAYVNGKLNLFEFPYELSVFDFSVKNHCPKHKMFFPFIFGTSAIKPIVHGIQAEQLAKVRDILKQSDTLVVIGYKINEDDNHLNSFLREFLYDCSSDNNFKRIIYCHYDEIDSIEELNVTKNILELLRINKPNDESEYDFRRNLKVLHNRGDAEELFIKISEVLESAW